jgi:valyl-tRNA synthetase
MKKEISKSYESLLEGEIYEKWEKSGFFSPEKVEEYLKEKGLETKKPFVITLPPPNANGVLHLGNTCGYSFHDLLGRFHRMTGHPTLLLPGKDHAGIQTETVFVKKLLSEGIEKTSLGRDEFYNRCYDFCINAAENARNQEKKVGLSADWEREFFTLDSRLTKTIYETFEKMLKEGLIYRGKRIINFCVNCQTALADIDTTHDERRGIFAYILYPFVNEEDNDLAEREFGSRGIVVATTRPETMLGDTAVAVNPKDKRYSKFVGKKVLLPIVNREIPVVAQRRVDMDLGGGAVKVTPAHSPIDFEIGLEHNLEVINVINENGLMAGPIPEKYKGLETIECSKELVKDLDEMGLLLKIEKIKHDVVICERCDTAIQPIVSYQWFVNTKPLAEKALKVLEKEETVVLPSGQMKSLKHFFENIQPWCISRQLWWGHRIPIWYKGGKKAYDESLENPSEKNTSEAVFSVECPGDDYEQETDVFDTWFSSGQWPFSTLQNGKEGDFGKYYPTDVMIHGRDILFWWSARMMMLGLYRTGKTPFAKIFVTGMIMAPDGSKMSKSRDNSVSPEVIIEKYGADALRLWYYTDSLAGANAPLREEKIKGNRFFVNKIWNASRFVLMNIKDEELTKIQEILNKGDFNDAWLEEVADFEKEIKENIANYKFHLGAEKIREFFWHTFCDKWIEEVKGDMGPEKLALLIFLLKRILITMHPFVPFVTESVWQELVHLGIADDLLIMQQQ